MQKNSNTGATATNDKSIKYSIENTTKVQNVPFYGALQDSSEHVNGPSVTRTSKTTENRVINKLSCNKEIVRIKKASKFYGSGNNKKQVLCNLDLSIREGDM